MVGEVTMVTVKLFPAVTIVAAGGVLKIRPMFACWVSGRAAAAKFEEISCDVPEMVIAAPLKHPDPVPRGGVTFGFGHTVGVHCVEAGVICALLGTVILSTPVDESAKGPSIPDTGVTGVVANVGGVLNGSGPNTK